LAELFARHKGERSYREMREKAESAGYWAAHVSWQQWAREGYVRAQFPAPETIKAFAVGLGVSETEVLLAAGRSLGLDVGLNNETDLILPGAGSLGAADRDVLASMAALLTAKEAQVGVLSRLKKGE
jgi:hypothetical protein